jgi:serine/threonine protein kinase/tetratricopeptide (TPR) repeat protein
MSLSTGTRLGHYEVEALLGAGGMGEVYRARDLRLDRTVAIKALPQGFARDPERLARFEREAKLLASLAHPNIAGIYGLQDADGSVYLVLEFVDGETLAQRLARGPLPTREVLDVGAQVAAAIEAAHERDVIHRDLKPGNVMFLSSGAVKVVDFGLAKGAPAGAVASGSMMPTAAAMATADGIILGTAPYMSPEQARGQSADRRTDVWAFGCLLFECLSARQVFFGDTVSDVIARILEREPDWSAIPAATPVRLRDLLRRCLTKAVKDRPRDIGDLRRELVAIAQEMSSPSGIGVATRVPSLAVLYFENPGGDAESDYFCAGITEDILTDLSKLKRLRVASRNAVARYREAAVDIARVGADLGVDAVLEGSVRRSGDRVGITAQLIGVADGFHLWAERYDRTLQDVFAVQEEIASSIAAALKVALTPSESANLVQDRPNDVRAYDLYLKGRAEYGHYTADSLRLALTLFQQATAIDPGYALAWAGAADCYGQMIQWQVMDPAEAGRLGLEAAHRAIELNPNLPEAHKAEALVRRYMGDRAGERRALARALEANPRFVPALINLCVDAFCEGDLAGAERLSRRSVEVDPQFAFGATWLAWLLIFTARYEEMLVIAQRMHAMSTEPFYLSALCYFRAVAHLHRGDLASVERVVTEARSEGAGAADLQTIDAMIAARSGRMEDAKRMVRALKDEGGIRASHLVMAAQVAVRVGELDLARGFLARNVVLALAPTIVRLEPDLHALLDAPPFAPRRRDVALVWPLEAPMIDAARHALFREVRIESGTPRGSDSLIPKTAERESRRG